LRLGGRAGEVGGGGLPSGLRFPGSVLDPVAAAGQASGASPPAPSRRCRSRGPVITKRPVPVGPAPSPLGDRLARGATLAPAFKAGSRRASPSSGPTPLPRQSSRCLGAATRAEFYGCCGRPTLPERLAVRPPGRPGAAVALSLGRPPLRPQGPERRRARVLAAEVPPAGNKAGPRPDPFSASLAEGPPQPAERSAARDPACPRAQSLNDDHAPLYVLGTRGSTTRVRVRVARVQIAPDPPGPAKSTSTAVCPARRRGPPRPGPRAAHERKTAGPPAPGLPPEYIAAPRKVPMSRPSLNRVAPQKDVGGHPLSEGPPAATQSIAQPAGLSCRRARIGRPSTSPARRTCNRCACSGVPASSQPAPGLQRQTRRSRPCSRHAEEKSPRLLFFSRVRTSSRRSGRRRAVSPSCMLHEARPGTGGAPSGNEPLRGPRGRPVPFSSQHDTVRRGYPHLDDDSARGGDRPPLRAGRGPPIRHGCASVHRPPSEPEPCEQNRMAGGP